MIKNKLVITKKSKKAIELVRDAWDINETFAQDWKIVQAKSGSTVKVVLV